MSDNQKTASIGDVRAACRQFAMLYFQFCRTLVETVGEEAALKAVQKTIFRLGLDRTDGARSRADTQGLEKNLENFSTVNDLPSIAWSAWNPSMGGVKCPYAETWLGYFAEFPWFKRFSSFYCDVIDTTNIENFSRTTSCRITKNLLLGALDCEWEYFESEKVKAGVFTYGEREKS
ncbi:hypothetical protein [Treponema primitia]|uniref:hypothetical protein n=1 Tax=Treponema primitia TaxID=88058 RepID=UPI0002555926|nr:hypothetical protein [Treponema primitia]